MLLLLGMSNQENCVVDDKLLAGFPIVCWRRKNAPTFQPRAPKGPANYDQHGTSALQLHRPETVRIGLAGWPGIFYCRNQDTLVSRLLQSPRVSITGCILQSPETEVLPLENPTIAPQTDPIPYA